MPLKFLTCNVRIDWDLQLLTACNCGCSMNISSEISEVVSNIKQWQVSLVFGSADMIIPPLQRERKLEPVPVELVKN